MTSTSDFVTARNGVRLLTRHWPATGSSRGSVLLIHGLAEHSGRYDRTGSILGAAGLDVTGLDLEGFGGSGGRRAWIPGWDVWLDDVGDRLEAIRASVDGSPVMLFGHSMGGLVALTYAESDRPQPDLLVLSSPWLADHLPIWRRAGAQVLGRVVPTLEVANGFDGSTLSRDPAVGEAYLADPHAYHRTTTGLGREVLAAQKRANADLRRLRIPTFVTHGGADPLVPTASSEALGALPGVTRKVYPDLRHETLNEPEGPQVAADIAAWILARIEASSARV